jgi:hypothetical protein
VHVLELFATSDDGNGSIWAGIAIGSLIWSVLVIVGWWKIFEKAGEAGWKAIIPIYNIYVLLRIVGRPGWMLIGLLIPFVNIIFLIILMGDLAKSFGRGFGFVLGLIFLNPLFALILGFGSASYVGPTAEQGQRF